VKGKRRTTTIRIAMQPPKQVASVRGASVLVAPWRSVLLLTFQVFINRPTNQPRNREVLTDRYFLQFLKLLRLEPYGGELLSHYIHYTTLLYELARKSYFYALQQGPSSCSALVQPRSFALWPTHRTPLHPSGTRGIVGIKQRDNRASLRGRAWRAHDRQPTSTTEETLCHATNSKLRCCPRSPPIRRGED